jgi:uncharacterized membrane protein
VAEDRSSASGRWVPLTTTVLAVAGLAVSLYLTISHYAAPDSLACPDTGAINCVKVTTSPESVIFGVPVALYGLLFFAAMTAANLPAAWRRTDSWLVPGRLVATGVGIVFVLYLVYVELFVVDAICLWCTAVHVLVFALFVVTLIGSVRTPAP